MKPSSEVGVLGFFENKREFYIFEDAVNDPAWVAKRDIEPEHLDELQLRIAEQMTIEHHYHARTIADANPEISIVIIDPEMKIYESELDLVYFAARRVVDNTSSARLLYGAVTGRRTAAWRMLNFCARNRDV